MKSTKKSKRHADEPCPLSKKTLGSIFSDMKLGGDVRVIKTKVPCFDKTGEPVACDGMWVGVPEGRSGWGVWVFAFDEKGGMVKLKSR